VACQKFCQIISWKSDCGNEVLSDYFMKFIQWKWSSVSLNYECCTVLAWFCQASCSGLKRVYDQTLSPLICCTSPSPVNWFTFFSCWRFYLLPLTTSGCRIKCEQCFLLCRRGQATLGWESLASSQYACTSWCAPVPARHVNCIPLQSAWVEPNLAAVIKTTLVLLRINPSWLNLLSTENSNIRNFN